MAKRNDNLKRVIVDFKKLTPEILALLVEKYPDGYDEDHIVSFRNAQNEIVEAVEVRTEDTIYLVKVGKRLVKAMEDFNDDDDSDVGIDSTDDVEVDIAEENLDEDDID